VLGAGFYVLVLLHFGDPEKGPIATGLGGLALTVAALTAVGFAVFHVHQEPGRGRRRIVRPLPAPVRGELARGVHARVGAARSCSGCPSRRTSTASPKGNVASGDLLYFVSLGALGLFAARTTIASQRWR